MRELKIVFYIAFGMLTLALMLKIDDPFYSQSLVTACTMTESTWMVKGSLLVGTANDFEENRIPPLVAAANIGNLEILSLLLDAGADPNLAGAYRPPLLASAAEGYPRIAKELLARGADINAKDWQGRSALAWAARSGTETVAKVLIQHGADVNLVDKKGNPPLYHSIVRGSSGITRALIKSGVTVNLQNKEGFTPLFGALIEWDQRLPIKESLQRSTIVYLLENGQDLDIPTPKGLTLRRVLNKSRFASLLE